MKVKMFFLIFLMNVTSYLGRGECNCCECLENCWGDKKKVNNMVPEVNEMNVENEPEVNEMNVENEKENSEIKNKGPRDFVNTTWLKEKEKQENFVLRLFDKTEDKNEYKSKDVGITIKLKKDGDKTVIENSDEVKEKLKTDIGKWALFEIKTVDNETHYLYCSDIESKKIQYLERGIFEEKEIFFSISVLACDTINVKSMYRMFFFCHKLKTLDLSKFNTSSVTNMSYMFDNCYSLGELDLSSFDTKKCTSMYNMFCGCNNLKNLNLSNFFTSFDLENRNLEEILDRDFLRDSYSLQFIYFKNQQIAETFINKYCIFGISFGGKTPERKYEYFYDEEKEFHCVKVTESI